MNEAEHDRYAFSAFDLLTTMVAVVSADGECLFVNTAFEAHLGMSRRSMQGGGLFDWFVDVKSVRETVQAVVQNHFSNSRFEAQLRCGPHLIVDILPVHVIVTQMDGDSRVLLELTEVEQQTRQEREERALDQAQANKELIRNLAHEIKNPLGGLRGAAQLLAMELASEELTEYTDVIVHEADRLQSLVDRLLAPHRKAQVVGDVNIHEICERVRALILLEYPRGLKLVRDYDTSLPDFRGDREQLIQAVLNIVQNAAQALSERITTGDACIILRTRAARQVTLGKQRWRLALELHIEDNGPGVPPEIRDRIFYPLVTGRDGGSGLGLTLAQTFVQQHLGTITCDSVPGRTDFLITLPLP